MKDVITSPIEKLLVGVEKVATAVAGTLGARGRNVFLDTTPPRITNDGNTIAKDIELEDRLENLGAWLVKNCSAQTNDDVGDGTTTTAVLVSAIIHEALKRPENKMFVAQSLKEALPSVLEKIKGASKQTKDLISIARISAENETLAAKVAELVEKVGSEGAIRVEENNEPEIAYEIVEGYEANVGFMSPHFTNTPRLTCEFESAPIFCSQRKIGTVGDIANLFEQIKEMKINKIVIVAEEIDNEILGIFVTNKKLGLLNILVIRATGPLLEDIASATGATLVSEVTGVTFDNFKADKHLGQASVVSEEKRTIFLSKSKTAKEQAERLEALADMNPNEFEAKRARERAQKLRKGIAVLRVGSPSTVEMAYLRDKADDAIHATQAALEEGIVEGGGMCLWRIAQAMEPKTVGEEIIRKALCAPLKQICDNSGVEYAEIVNQITDKTGFNAKDGVITNLFTSGVVDPAKVERVAVTNALLNASLFITTHAAIITKEEKK